MMKRLNKIFILFILFIIFTMPIVLSYKDNLFKFDLPENYKKYNFDDQLIVFMDENNEKRGFTIIVFDAPGLKKSVWDIDKQYLREITASNMEGTIIEVDDRAKLGKEKAVKYIVQDRENNEYIDIYLLASNKYIYMVAFVGETISELSNEDYNEVKYSFKLKDSTTNANVVYFLVFIVGVVIRIIVKSKKVQKQYNVPRYNKNIDYKNMTEEDFNKL